MGLYCRGEKMLENNVKKIVFSSTAATYGEPKYTPIDELHPQEPINPYGQSKLMIEKIMDDYSKAYNLKSVRLRYFNVAGADSQLRIGEWHEPETHLIPNILKSIFGKEQKFKIYISPTPQINIDNHNIIKNDDNRLLRRIVRDNKYRNNNIDTKVIMLTAKSSLDDKLIGFELGSDDYLTKPFSPKELEARVKAVLRRTISKDVIIYDDINDNIVGKMKLKYDEKTIIIDLVSDEKVEKANVFEILFELFKRILL